MIDLKRPLEGIPGLLLMAVLVLFGATIGVVVALAASWVELKDSIANFLGGVVGAGLGSALAILGAVYVQRRDARQRLNAPLNELLEQAQRIAGNLSFLQRTLRRIEPETEDRQNSWAVANAMVDSIQKWTEELPDGREFPTPIYEELKNLKERVNDVMGLAQGYLRAVKEKKASAKDYRLATAYLDDLVPRAAHLVTALAKV
ncbi:MAG: hypothetical protein K2X72_19275 [Reyranella sp.]|nr:hypothetical protein [Reyranella sp.]